MQFKNRKELILHLNKINAKVVVEVGVREGYFSKFILDNTSVEKLYAIDPWERNSELQNSAEQIFYKYAADELFWMHFIRLLNDDELKFIVDNKNNNKELVASFVLGYIQKENIEVQNFLKKYDSTANDAYTLCKNLLEPFSDRAEMVKGYSPFAAEMFDDNSLDFVYIDGLHDYKSVKADIEAFYPKIIKGGIIAGHDYHLEDWPGVYHAVNEFCVHNKLELGITGIETDEIDNDGSKPSFYFIKK